MVQLSDRPSGAAGGETNMGEHVGILIAATRRRIKQAVLARVAGSGLSAQQFWFLIAVSEVPGTSQAELGERLHCDPPTVSRVVFALRRRRLVRREVDPTDRRRSRLVLTAAGERLAGELAPVASEIRRAVVEGMTEPEVELLRHGLRRVISNLDRLGAAAGVLAPDAGSRRSA
jgi:DNA-binding MarR family transcriptional regulator